MEYAKERNRNSNYVSVNTLVQPKKNSAKLMEKSTGAGAIQEKANHTGMPDNLKTGVERLSGIAMDDVKVHYNSNKPTGLGALAYTQGTDIHVAPGQERHLPHEAWHVAQQKEGRVKPTGNIGGVPLNNSGLLEKEADTMGAKALQLKIEKTPAVDHLRKTMINPLQKKESKTLQLKICKYCGCENRQDNRPESHELLSNEYPIQRVKFGKAPRFQETFTTRTGLTGIMIREWTPSVVEVGAGEGRFSAAFRKKFGRNYLATDIAKEEGPTGFLKIARKHVRTKFGVDANKIGKIFPRGTLDRVVAANPFGMKGVAGASFGLKMENPGGKGKKRYLPDGRFLRSVRPLLKPGGSVEIYGRSNMLRDAAVAKVPRTGKKGSRTAAEQKLVEEVKKKYSGENKNPYLDITPEELHTLAKATGYKVKVKRAKQPSETAIGGNPDTIEGDSERAKTGLKPFNTRFSFTPEEQGYISDDDPRVDYSSGEESDWEE